MAAWDYDESLAELLKSEGGYTNNPSDPGGPTNFGITIADYRHYVKPDATASDVRNMRVEEAMKIYRAKYWDAQRCDDLPAGVDYTVFDFGVNSGISRSGKYLQRIVGVTADGVIGDKTIAAVNDYVAQHGAKELEDTINEQRLSFLKHLRTWSVFGKGWGRRVEKVDTISDDMELHPEKYGSTVTFKTPKPLPKPTVTIKPSKPVDPYSGVGSVLNFVFKLIQGFLKKKG